MNDYKFKTRRLDDNGDIMLSGDMWIYDIEAVAQTVQTRLKLFSKEFWRDINEGVPWISKILNKNGLNNTLQAKNSIIKNRILETKHVLSILSFDSSFDYNSRKLTITVSLITDFGQTQPLTTSTTA